MMTPSSSSHLLLLMVYDSTSFMDDHPGGDNVMISSIGKDAMDDFEDVGHNKIAIDMLDRYYISDIDPPTYKATHVPPSNKSSISDHNDKASTRNSSFMTKMLQLLVPIIILGLALAVKKFTKVE